MSRRGTRWVGAIGAIVAVLTVALQLLNAVDLRTEATVLVALLAALAGFVAQRAIAVGQSRADEAERDRVLDDALAWWPPPLVGEADPYELGAFPPESGDYVDRAADEKLQAALAEPGYVVAVGPVGAGKSRAAFQALQATVPLAALLVPEDGESLGRLIAADPQLPGGEQGTVLWLDCIDRFIPGLRLDAVDRWVGDGNVRVVGTLAEDQRDKLVKAGGPEGHIARRLLGRAAVVTVKDTLTAAEAEAAGAAFPERDFSTGMAGAFREHWQPSAAARPPRFATPPAKRRWRPDPWLALTIGVAIGVTAALVRLHVDQGLGTPPPMEEQIAELKLDLAGCGLETFAGDEDNMPIVATVDAGRDCDGHAIGADGVLVYDVRDERLRPVFDFGPPRAGFPQQARFGCRGGGPHPCWTDVTGRGDHAIIGVFRDPDTQALLPVAAWRDRARGWRVDPLLTEPPALAEQFRAATYREPIDIGERKAYRVADLAVLPARLGDRPLPARAIVGFADREALLSPDRLEAQARPLAFEAGVAVRDPCLVVRAGVPVEHLLVPVADGALADALRRQWARLEKAREGICVLSR